MRRKATGAADDMSPSKAPKIAGTESRGPEAGRAPKDRRLTLPQAAKRLQWSVRHLKSRLAAHSISPIGRGRAARLTEDDFKQLEAKERQPCRTSSSRPESGAPIGTSGGRTPAAAFR